MFRESGKENIKGEQSAEEKARNEELNRLVERLKDERDYGQIIDLVKTLLPSGYSVESADNDSGFGRNYASQDILWRGTDPLEILKLLSGKSDIVLKSKYPNISDKWETSIAFGVPKEESGLRFNLAVGFRKNDELSLEDKSLSVEEQRKTPQSVVLSQQGNIVGNGPIRLDDVRLLVLRTHGYPKAEERPSPIPPGPLMFFAVKKSSKKQEEYKEAA